MTEFLFGQLDYVYFCWGLALVLLAFKCFELVRAGRSLLPWSCLGYFALLQGLNEWIRLLLHAFGVHQATTFILCLATTTVSFGLLLEFARAGWQDLDRRGPGRWLLWVCFGLVIIGALWGLEGLGRSLYYALALPAGLGSGIVIWHSASKSGWEGVSLRVAGLALAVYALTFGFSLPLGCSFPADLAYQDTFGALTGFPIQIVRTITAWLSFIPLWLWGRQFIPEEMDRFNLRVRRRLTWGMALTTLTLLVLGWMLTQFLGTEAKQKSLTINQHYLRQFQYCLNNEIDETHSIAQAVAGSTRIAGALHPGDFLNPQDTNVMLDRFSAAFEGTVIYLMNLQGVTVASSNRQRPDSFVGKSYVFRPYFQQAIAGKNGSYMALGMTSKERGYYASATVYDAAAQIIGVAVVKRSIDQIESMLNQEAPAFLVNPQGIIFLASRPEMTLKSLWPVAEQALPEIITSRQFGSGPFPALLSHRPTSGSQVRLHDHNWFYLAEPSIYEGWQVAVLGSTQGIVMARFIGIGLTLFFCLTSLGLFVVWDTTLEASARIGVSERIYRSLVEGAPDCVSLFDREGRFLAVNPNGRHLLGLPEADILGLPLARLWPLEQGYLVEEAIHRVWRGEKTVFEMSYQHPLGKKLGWQVILNPIQETDGNVRRFVGIITDVTERQEAEANLQYRLELEALIAKISTEFINLPSEKIGEGINRALETLGGFVRVDRAYVFQLHDQGCRASNTYEWCASGVTPEQPRLQGLLLDEALPWFAGIMRRFEVCRIPRVADLPREAAAEKAEFTREGIQSLVVVPMVHQGSLVGFFGFDAVRETKVWNEDTITILKMVGDLLVNVLERKRAEEALHLDEARLETLVQLGQMQDRPFREIVLFAMEEAVRLTRSQIGYLAFLDAAETTLTMHTWSEQTLQQCGIADPPLVYALETTGLWGEAVRQRRPIITNDYTAANPWKKGFPQGHVEVRRHMNIPVFEGTRIVAVAGVGNKEEPYNDADVRQLTLLMDGMWKLVQRKEAEEALAAEKERLAVTLSSIGDAVIATDMDGNIQLMNHVAEELTGWTQAESWGRPALEICRIFDSRTRKPCTTLIPQILAGEASAGLSTFLLSRDGREIPIAESGAPIIDQNQQVRGAVLVFRNITLKKRMEEELLKVEKLRSLGILAGGIAHDFNNILTAILGNISLGILYAGDDPREKGNLQERLLEAEKATLRARDLVQQLLTFAKGGAPVKQLASLKEIVEESASFSISGSRSRCQFDLPQDLWPVEVDEGQISQVVQNLVINASQAMPEGGVISLGAENVVLDNTSGLTLPPGRYAKLTISDQGIGIPADHLSRIFDPYFSTKQQGSGLGLATVYSIVTNHEGQITVESQLGRGTSFAFYLPASRHLREKVEPARPVLYPGEGRILVMDDEEMVREVVGRMLQQLGYKVEFVADGQEAVARFRKAQEESQPFAGLLLDLTVPGGMGGREAMEKLLALDPEVVSLVSSGHAEDAIMTHYQEYGFKGYIKKPYRIEDLSKALHLAMKGG